MDDQQTLNTSLELRQEARSFTAGTAPELRIPAFGTWRIGFVSTILETIDVQGNALRALVWISTNDGAGLALFCRTTVMTHPVLFPLDLLTAQLTNQPTHMPVVFVGHPSMPLFAVKSVDLETGSVQIILDQSTSLFGFSY